MISSSSTSSFTYRPKLSNLTSINHSQFSVLTAMDRFVNSVEKMQAIILVPSRLKDLQLDNEQTNLLGQSDAYGLYLMLDEIKRELLWGGSSTGASAVAMELASNFNNLTLTSDLSSTPKESSVISQKITNQHLQLNDLVKCQSDTSLSFCDPIKRLKKQRTFSTTDDGFSSMHEGSSNSLALSDDDSIEPSESLDASSEAEDSETGCLQMKTKCESSIENKDTFHLIAAFRLHLRGLSALCNQLADTAEFISEKYQNELK